MDCAWCHGVGCPLNTVCRRWVWYATSLAVEQHPMQSYVMELYDPVSNTCAEQLPISIHEED